MVSFLAFLLSFTAQAETFDQLSRSLSPGLNRNWNIHGYQRVRSSGYYNLDLDHGLTPSGASLFPVPITEGQWLSSSDLRLRADISGVSERGSVAVNVRIDMLDNIRLGSLPQGTAIDSTSQLAPEDSIVVRQAYATALTPLGFVVAGRMGTTWGLGMLANSGDCIDCNTVDVSDRVGFLTSLAGHLWAITYDFSSTGAGISRMYNVPDIDLESTDDAHSITFAVMKMYSDFALSRRRLAGKNSFEYGFYSSTRDQLNDISVSYLSEEALITQTALLERNYQARAFDGWFRFTAPKARIEWEAAYMIASIGNPSLLSGVAFEETVTSNQFGMALETELGDPEGKLRYGLDLGLASGDSAPGFGARAHFLDTPPVAGDLDGPQFSVGKDNTVDNFRFHPDFQIDRILWREIIGTVTDAIYIKPHLEWELAKAGPGILKLHQGLVYSMAMEGNSTPSGEQPLGLEWDPSIEYVSTDGMGFQVDYAILFPLDGLENTIEGLNARPAQLIRTHLRYRF